MAANALPPPPIQDKPGSFTWLEWYRQLRAYVSTSGSVPWYVINFAGSNITDIALRDHANLQNLQGGTAGEYYHLTSAEYASLAGGGADIKSTTITIPYGVTRGTATVVDASVTALSQIILSWGTVASTDENDPEMDDVSFFATPAAGSFDVTVVSATKQIGGTFNLNYLLG